MNQVKLLQGKLNKKSWLSLLLHLRACQCPNVFRQFFLDTFKMVTGQSVNDNQTRHSSLTTQPSRTNTYPALSLSLCLSATLSLSNTHTLAAVFAFCVSSLEHVSFLLLFFSLSVSLAVCSPPPPSFSVVPPETDLFFQTYFSLTEMWLRMCV